MLPRHSLRLRVALVFAIFGALLSILFSAGIYVTARELEHRLMDETLHAELEDSATRLARNPLFIPTNTVSIKGYLQSGTAPAHGIPDEIRTLLPGSYNIKVGAIDYRALVADRNGSRFFLLFDTEHQHQRELSFFHFLSFFAVFMTLVSAGGGFWLAVRIVNPVTQLARCVAQAQPGNTSLALAKLARGDEVGVLARAFDRYLRRMQKFIDREHFFTADVGHELRTPLAIVLSTVEVLEQDKTLTLKQAARIERIKRSAQDMSELSAALLLLAREHRPASDEPACDVGHVLRATVKKHHHLIAHRPVHVEIALTAAPQLHVERHLLEIVIGNLLRNALFHTASGTITLRLQSDCLTIGDTGCGIPPDELPHALERGYKGASSMGAGVGLSLVQRICDRYGWRFCLHSQAGCGTTAVIEFAAATCHRGEQSDAAIHRVL